MLYKNQGLATLVLAVVVFLHIHVPAMADASPACAGQDVFAAIKDSDPAAHARIISQAKETPNTEAILWKIEREGRMPSWLFGTAHLHDPRLLDFPDTLDAAIPKASAIALELEDFSATAMAAEMAQLGSMMIFTDGQTLSKFLTEGELAQVSAILKPQGVPETMAPMFKPWAISLMLAISPCQNKLLAAGKPGVDQEIARRAKSHGVKIVGLETIREQMTSAASADIEGQVAALKSALETVDRVDDMTETLVQLYLKRKLGALIPLSIEIAKNKANANRAMADMQRNLIDIRNNRMRDRALPLLEQGNAIIAVGALHLVGKTGLVALLREAGYTVTAVD